MDDKLVERINAKAEAIVAKLRKEGKLRPPEQRQYSKPSPLSRFIKTKEQAEIFMVLLKHDWQWNKKDESK